MIALKVLALCQLALLSVAMWGGFRARQQFSKQFRSVLDYFMLYFTASVVCTLALFIIL